MVQAYENGTSDGESSQLSHNIQFSSFNTQFEQASTSKTQSAPTVQAASTSAAVPVHQCDATLAPAMSTRSIATQQQLVLDAYRFENAPSEQVPVPQQQLTIDANEYRLHDEPQVPTTIIVNAEQPSTEGMNSTTSLDMVWVSSDQMNAISTQVEFQGRQINVMHTLLNTVIETMAKNASTVAAKLDYIAENHIRDTCIFEAIDSEEALKAANENLTIDKGLHGRIVKQFGSMFGVKTGQGDSAALHTIYRIFSREFLRKCSWSGAARAKGETKIALSEYSKVTQLFWSVVAYSDATYTFEMAKLFLQARMKNAKTHAKSQNLRTPNSRPKRRLEVSGGVPRKQKKTAAIGEVLINNNVASNGNAENSNPQSNAASNPNVVITPDVH